MKFKTINKEDLETMSFDDIAYVILKEKNKKMKVSEIFKIICVAECGVEGSARLLYRSGAQKIEIYASALDLLRGVDYVF